MKVFYTRILECSLRTAVMGSRPVNTILGELTAVSTCRFYFKCYLVAKLWYSWFIRENCGF